MSLPLGYPPSVSTSIPSTTLLMSTPPTTTAASGAASPCCENGRPVMTDPHTGQTICSCQYPAGLLAAAYSRVPGLAEGVYPSPYAAQQGLMTLGATDPSAFYAPIGLSGSAPCYTYDPTMGAYGYSNGFMDPNARRKNATRESTNTLKAWLSEHRKNPYPTKGEKIMLAIITKMTLTQVSTWFANARRRLKKENKMTWSPRNRCDEDGDDEDGNSDDDHNEHNKKDHDDDDVLDDSEFINVDCDKEDDDAAQEESERAKRDRISSTSESEDVSRPEVQSATSCKSPPSGSSHNGCPSPHGSNCSSPNTTSPGLPPRIPLHPGLPIRPLGLPATTATALNYSHLKNNANVGTSASSSLSSPSQTSSATNRPKIWSIADVATSSDNHSDRKSPTVTSGPPNAQQLQPSHAGPIRPQHIGAHSGLPAGFGRSWAAAAVAANGLSHPYSLAPHFLGLHRDPTSSVGSFISGPNTSTILSRFGFPPMAVSTSSLADPKRLPGGAPVVAPANR